MPVLYRYRPSVVKPAHLAVSIGGGGSTDPTGVQRAYDPADTRFYTWTTTGAQPDTSGTAYPGSTSTAAAALVVMRKT